MAVHTPSLNAADGTLQRHQGVQQTSSSRADAVLTSPSFWMASTVRVVDETPGLGPGADPPDPCPKMRLNMVALIPCALDSSNLRAP